MSAYISHLNLMNGRQLTCSSYLKLYKPNKFFFCSCLFFLVLAVFCDPRKYAVFPICWEICFFNTSMNEHNHSVSWKSSSCCLFMKLHCWCLESFPEVYKHRTTEMVISICECVCVCVCLCVAVYSDCDLPCRIWAKSNTWLMINWKERRGL